MHCGILTIQALIYALEFIFFSNLIDFKNLQIFRLNFKQSDVMFLFVYIDAVILRKKSHKKI